jgi:hypothetical protein
MSTPEEPGPAGPGDPAAGVSAASGAGAPEDGGGVPDEAPRSGLRNPGAAVRGLGAATLGLEGIVLLLAIQPIRIMGGHLSGWGIGAVVAAAVLAFVLTGMMKRPWAWGVGTALQVLLLAGGVLHWALTLVGVIFSVAWGYALYVRHSILG